MDNFWDNFLDENSGSNEPIISEALKLLREETDLESTSSLWPDVWTRKGDPVREFQFWEDSPLEEILYGDNPTFMLVKGGEGSGKSVVSMIYALEKIKKGCEGAILSPELQNFKRAYWPEFSKWIPEKALIPRHRYMLETGWRPSESFVLTFISERGHPVDLRLGGMPPNPMSWEGPTLNWMVLDEARQYKDNKAIRMVQGRLRKTGPSGEAPQCLLSTTPLKNWLFDYFGNCDPDDEEYDPEYDPDKDSFLSFKKMCKYYRLPTSLNKVNDASYLESRAAGMTQNEIDELLKGFWVDYDNNLAFLAHSSYWDRLKGEIPENYKVSEATRTLSHVRVVGGLDGSTSRDHTAFVLLARNPNDVRKSIVLHAKRWIPSDFPSGRIDFSEVKKHIRKMNEIYNIVCIAYDQHQLENLAQDLQREDSIWFSNFNQQTKRRLSDKKLWDMIMDKEITHDGDEILREHVLNAGKEIKDDKTLRIVKVTEGAKIDLSVALSMGNYKLFELAT